MVERDQLFFVPQTEKGKGMLLWPGLHKFNLPKKNTWEKPKAHSHLKCNVADFSSGSDKRDVASIVLHHHESGVRRW